MQAKGERADSIGARVTFKHGEPQRWFANSREGSLPNKVMTERELVEEALRCRPDLTIEALIHEGTLFFARDLLRRHNSPGLKKAGTAPGRANKRIVAALKQIVKENVARRREGKAERVISKYTLAFAAKTNVQTAQRWMERNHELLERIKDGKE